MLYCSSFFPTRYIGKMILYLGFAPNKCSQVMEDGAGWVEDRGTRHETAMSLETVPGTRGFILLLSQLCQFKIFLIKGLKKREIGTKILTAALFLNSKQNKTKQKPTKKEYIYFCNTMSSSKRMRCIFMCPRKKQNKTPT